MDEIDLAPIVLFVYNRPHHTLQTLQALQNNELAADSLLYIFADGPKSNASEEEREKIRQVRELINKEKWCGEVVIFEHDENNGLANSVIPGVTKVINKHGKIIVLEDDLVAAKNFLAYMNKALMYYEFEEKVKQVAGYFPLTNFKYGESFFMPLTTTWGWATWKRVWNEVDFNASDYQEVKINKKLSRKFDLGGRINYSEMLITQMETRKISSWGIRFWWDIFKKQGLILFPDYTLISNIGFDNSGTHCKDDITNNNLALNFNYKVNFYPKKIEIDMKVYNSYLKSLSKNKKEVIKDWIKRLYTIVNEKTSQ